MTYKQDIIKELLNGLSCIDDFLESSTYEETELKIASRQFHSWLTQTAIALEVAKMHSERSVWSEFTSKAKNDHFEDLFLHMRMAKAVLLGMLEVVSSGTPSEELFSISIFEEAPTYIQRIAVQVNGCYERGWYDSGAVMTRRLVETLIIECFEKHGLEANIKNTDGNYVHLGELISRFLAGTWHISRNTKTSLPKLKDIKSVGDLSAHNRRFLATRRDIDRFADELRVVVQELIYIAGMGKNVTPSA